MSPSKTRRSRAKRRLDARPDPIDFRDRMYVPTLIEVPMRRPLERYLEASPRASRRSSIRARKGPARGSASLRSRTTCCVGERSTPIASASACACSTRWLAAMTTGPVPITRARAPGAR